MRSTLCALMRSALCVVLLLLSLCGTTAVVTGVGRYKVNSRGRTMLFAERFTDVYVKRKGRWQPVASHTMPLKPPQQKPAGGGTN